MQIRFKIKQIKMCFMINILLMNKKISQAIAMKIIYMIKI
jgi:hypothetical protein